jgi:hypothetical protein
MGTKKADLSSVWAIQGLVGCELGRRERHDGQCD